MKKGWHLSEKTRKRISTAMRGRKLSKETREKISKNNLGKHHPSPEHLEKITRAARSRKHTPEELKKMHQSMLGKYLSEEHKEKLRRANEGKRLSESTKQKISIAIQGSKNPRWHTPGFERADSDGRVWVKTDTGWRYRYQIVAEVMLGRPLTPEEVVHHKNENPGDDRPENLQVFPCDSDHARLHAKLRCKDE